MREECGRSLIEILGVLAIAGVMTMASIGFYRMLRNNGTRSIASAELAEIARNVKILMETRGDYNGVSVDYLIKAGALKSSAAPIGGENWSVVASADGASFSINLTDLSKGECDYFTTTTHSWASALLVNGYETDTATRCFSSQTNQISFIVE